MPSPYLSNYGVVAFAGSSLTLTAAGYAGQTVVSTIAAAQTITLPAATGSGNIYRVFFNVTASGNKVIQVASSSDIMQGAIGMSTDAAGVTIPTASTSDTITLNGSTTGGVKGSHVELQDVASGVWRVSGFLVSTGAEATPFSANV